MRRIFEQSRPSFPLQWHWGSIEAIWIVQLLLTVAQHSRSSPNQIGGKDWTSGKGARDEEDGKGYNGGKGSDDEDDGDNDYKGYKGDEKEDKRA